jgi:DNA polymerase type B, organellar and viral
MKITNFTYKVFLYSGFTKIPFVKASSSLLLILNFSSYLCLPWFLNVDVFVPFVSIVLLNSTLIPATLNKEDFNKIISTNQNSPSKIPLRGKVHKIRVRFTEMTEARFISILTLTLRTNSLNTILFQYSEYKSFTNLMLGSQVGIVVGDSHDIKYYRSLFEHYKDKLDILLDQYNISTSPDFIIIHLIEISIDEKLKLGKFTKPSSKLVKLNETKNQFNNNILPLTQVEKQYGSLLQDQLRINYLTDLINLLEKNILALINVSSDNSITLDFNKKNILAKLKDEKNQVAFLKSVRKDGEVNQGSIFNVYLSNNKLYLIISYVNHKNGDRIKIVFKIRTAKLLLAGKDSFNQDILKFLNKDTCNHFVREIGNISVSLNKEHDVELFTKSIELSPIVYKDPDLKPKRKWSSKGFALQQTIATRDSRIGTLDLETLTEIQQDGSIFARVFAIGFATSKKTEMFYLTDYFDNTLEGSNQLVLKCIQEILQPEFNGYTFYVHNLGKFDAIFLQKIILDFNTQSIDKAKLFTFDPLYRNGKIIKLEIGKIINQKKVKIKLVDSLNILNNSLENLCNDFKVNSKKGIFPYSFVNKNNLNYVGDTPSIEFFNQSVKLELYNSFKKSDWSLRDETLNYLKLDILSLLEVILIFQEILWEDHNIELTKGLTISSLAKTKFLKYYLKDSKIPLINSNTMFQFIYGAYFGGITEVYIPLAQIFNYLDVNSLYPSAALNPMPGLNCKWIESYNSEGLDLSELFGFFHAEVETNSQYLGLLPLRTKSGVIFPEGKYEGIWTSVELQHAKELGYKIKVIKGFQFNKQESPFIEYVTELSELKDSLKGSPRQVVKSLLNNLIGRFGLNFVKPITKTVSKAALDRILATKEVSTFKQINENNYLVTFNPIVNKEICDSHNLDYFKVILEERNYVLGQNAIFQDVSIATAAFVTAYARIHMHTIKLLIMKIGGKIYYSDTDSIVTNLSLEFLLEKLPEKIGNKLGQLKLEHFGTKAYFISNKTYLLITDQNEIIKKAKGIFPDSLELSDFENMYFNSKSVVGVKTSSNTNYSKGSVTIQTNNITIDWNSFKKREKVYNSKNLWVNTKPLYIDNLTRSITLFQPLNIVTYQPLNIVTYQHKNIFVASR